MSERADRLAALVAERELDALLVGDLVRPGDSGPDAIANVRWLTGFSGTSGLAVVGADERTFLTDFRYAERAEGIARLARVFAARLREAPEGGSLVPGSELAALYRGLVAETELQVAPTQALSLSLLAYAGSLFWSLIGGVVYASLKERHHLAEVTRPDAAGAN